MCVYIYDSNIYDNSPTQQLGIVTLTNHHSSGVAVRSSYLDLDISNQWKICYRSSQSVHLPNWIQLVSSPGTIQFAHDDPRK